MEERAEVGKSGQKGCPAVVGTELSALLALPSGPVRTHLGTRRTRQAGELREAPRCRQLASGRRDSAPLPRGAAAGTLQTEGSLAPPRASGALLSPRCSGATGLLPPSFINLSLGSSSCGNSLGALPGRRPSSGMCVLALPHPARTHRSSSCVFRRAQAVLGSMPAE